MISDGNLGLWCARRLHEFVVISMSYQGFSNHKVHFEPKKFRSEGATMPPPKGPSAPANRTEAPRLVPSIRLMMAVADALWAPVSVCSVSRNQRRLHRAQCRARCCYRPLGGFGWHPGDRWRSLPAALAIPERYGPWWVTATTIVALCSCFAVVSNSWIQRRSSAAERVSVNPC